MNLNELLKNKKDNLSRFMVTNQPFPFRENDVVVFDIEACANKSHTEMLTFSIGFMSCYDETDTMYWYNNVEYVVDMLMNAESKLIKIYAHNCLYDVKPFLLKFVEKYGNNQKLIEFKDKKVYNSYTKKYEKMKQPVNSKKKLDKFQYDIIINNNVFYKLTIQSEHCTIDFLDSFKLIPFSLKKACDDFLGLKLPKDGLDYNKERTLNDVLTKEELNYIYDDVFGLKHLIKLCCIDGFDVNGKHIKFTKLTNSSQSLHDYKQTLVEDYERKENAFANKEFYKYVEGWLKNNGFYEQKTDYMKANLLFKAVFDIPQITVDKWIRKSYYGGLCTPHYDNVDKYMKCESHVGNVYDVNSLYPFVMKSFLLPYGKGIYKDVAYKNMNDNYKKQYPLYIQDITIYDIKVKPGHVAWLQVKGNSYFNSRELIETNNKDGQLIELNLRLCNPLFELLFEDYDVKSYNLGGHFAYRGTYGLFDNYINFWSVVKQNSEGAKRAVAKLRQNGLYGKFGTNGEKKETFFVNDNGRFKIEYGESYITGGVYLPMATFITSYAKRYLVDAINNNYDRFLYTDTDSIHLYGTEPPKGMKVDSKEYGAWDNEMTFDDFKYLSPKRYAERDIETKNWLIKCCGLTDKIMKQVDDLNVFDYCEFDIKTVKKMIKEGKLYKSVKEDDVYYYKDIEHKTKVIGLIKSKKAKVVKYGTDIYEQPYMITKSNNHFH